ncbi:MAG: hypothetical protein K6E51_03250 [Treponema sp.]|nr:hypothetical protein [Treponema sp.]
MFSLSLTDEYSVFVVPEDTIQVFSVSNATDTTVLIDRTGSEVKRRMYDANKLLQREEEWRIADDTKDMIFVSLTVYSYIPHSSVLDTCIIYSYETKQVETQLFTAAGLLERVVTAHYEGDVVTETTTDSITTFTYDEQSRIIDKKEELYVGSKHTKRQVYNYTDKSHKPDYVYYEDGKVRIKTVYSAENDYVQTSYFDEGYSVVVTYVDGTKVSETYLLNGRKIKT